MFSVIKSISKHSIVYGLGDLVGKGLGFILIPLYTHYLMTSEYGILELLDLTTYVVGLLLAMGIAQSVVRYYYEYEDKKRKDQVISIAMLTIWGISSVVLPLLIIFSSEISELVLDSSEFSGYFILVFITMVINLSNEIPMTLFRIKQQSTLYICVSMSKLVIALTLNILLLTQYNMGIEGILISGLTASSLAGIFLTAYTLRKTKISWSFSIFKEMIIYSFPLAWSWFGMFILHFGDRFLLQRLDGLDSVGIYSLAYKFGMMGNVLVLAPFMRAWGPKRFEIVKDTDAKKTYAYMFTYFILAYIYIILGIAILIEDVIGIVADQQYHSAYLYVPTILAAYIFYAIFDYMQFGILLKKKTKYLGFCALAVSVVNIALNYLLIPILNVWGATLVTLISFFLLAVTIYTIAQRLYYIPFQFGRLAKMAILALGLFFIASLIELQPVMLSLGVKFIIAFSYPLLLHFMRFYTTDEKAKLVEIRQQLFGIVKHWLWFSK